MKSLLLSLAMMGLVHGCTGTATDSALVADGAAQSAAGGASNAGSAAAAEDRNRAEESAASDSPELTDDQREQLDSLVVQLRADVESLHSAADLEIRSILSEAQLETWENLPSPAEFLNADLPGANMMGTNPVAGITPTFLGDSGDIPSMANLPDFESMAADMPFPMDGFEGSPPFEGFDGASPFEGFEGMPTFEAGEELEFAPSFEGPVGIEGMTSFNQISGLPGSIAGLPSSIGLGGGMPFMHGMIGGFPARPPTGPVVDLLGLSGEQESEFTRITDELHSALEARHEQFDQDFRSILTPEQIETLEQWEADRPSFAGGFSDPLNLTDEQRTEAETVFASLWAELAALHTELDGGIREILTDEQEAELEAIRPSMGDFEHAGLNMGPMGVGPAAFAFSGPANLGPNGFPGMPAGEWSDFDPVDRLGEDLDITTEQRAAFEVLFENFKTEAEDRLEKASTDFRAVLTSDQLATLDQIEAARSPAE